MKGNKITLWRKWYENKKAFLDDKIPSSLWILAVKEGKQSVLSNAYPLFCGLEVETPPQETEKKHIMSA